MGGIRQQEPNRGELSPPASPESYARLVFCRDDGKTITKDILRYTTLIGSGPASNLQLFGPTVAEAHCIITLESGRLCVRDLRTQTGTHVNGVAALVARLSDGDELQVGSFSFRVQTNLPTDIAEPREIDVPEMVVGGKSAMAQLVFRNLDDELIKKDLLRPTTLIGSSSGCHVQLVSPEIANVHCVITLESGNLRVRDLRSPLGTCVDNVSIEVAALADGDQLQLGAFSFGIETNLPSRSLSKSHLVRQSPTITEPSGTEPPGLEPPGLESQRQALREERATLQAAQIQFQAEQAQLREQLSVLEQDRARLMEEQRRTESLRAELEVQEARLETQRNQFRKSSQRERVRRPSAAARPPGNGNSHYGKTSEDFAVAAVTAVAAKSFPQGSIGRSQIDWLLEGCRYRGFFIGRYRILELLGTGSTGWLYEAEDTQDLRIVALKVLATQHVNDPGMRTRFGLEARSCIGLNHPNIVRTIEMDHVGETQFLVMDVAYGASLQELVELKGPVPWPQACDFAVQAARGLQVIHDSGVVHRDIKPANLLLTHSGELKIIDFGLALIRDDVDELTLKNDFGHDCMGTADYIPPEQARDSFTVDGTADIYSLGCTLYFALTGKLPFPVGSTAAKLKAHRNEEAVSVSDLVPDLPQDVADIVRIMMSKKRAQRHQGAAAVARALAPFAKRTPAYFDFTAILEARAQTAKKRMALLASRDISSQVAPSVVDRQDEKQGEQSEQNQLELIVR